MLASSASVATGMSSNEHQTCQDLGETIEEIANALQVVLLFASGLDRALCDTHWKEEAAGLLRAAERAASAASRLRGTVGAEHRLK